MPNIVPETYCTCDGCGCQDVCEFYSTAVKPVQTILKDEYLDRTDYTIKSYLDKLADIIEHFYCSEREDT